MGGETGLAPSTALTACKLLVVGGGQAGFMAGPLLCICDLHFLQPIPVTQADRNPGDFFFSGGCGHL